VEESLTSISVVSISQIAAVLVASTAVEVASDAEAAVDTQTVVHTVGVVAADTQVTTGRATSHARLQRPRRIRQRRSLNMTQMLQMRRLVLRLLEVTAVEKLVLDSGPDVSIDLYPQRLANVRCWGDLWRRLRRVAGLDRSMQ
jgi:hypothetical protein